MIDAAGRGDLRRVAALLDGGADPNAASNDGLTAAMDAARHGKLGLVTLLAVYGANLTATDDGNQTARSYTKEPAIVCFLDATEDWRPLRIAMACRTPPARLRALIATGKIDPTGCCPLPELIAAAADPAALWPGQPPVPAEDTAAELMVLLRLTMAPWSPSTHSLHHLRLRVAVRTVLLVSARYSRGNQGPRARPTLPPDLWRVVLGQLLRRDWQVARSRKETLPFESGSSDAESSPSEEGGCDPAAPTRTALEAACDEAERNFYFRNGDEEHTFEHGQQQVPEWRGKTEQTVLLDRVASGVKPIASFVVGSGDRKTSHRSMRFKNEFCNMTKQRGLAVHSVTNDWGMEVMYVCRADRVNSTLAELLEARIQEPHAAELSLAAELRSRCVGEYARSGFDCYFYDTIPDPSAKVSVLESALLLGYPFGLAHRVQHSAQSDDGSYSEDDSDSEDDSEQ